MIFNISEFHLKQKLLFSLKIKWKYLMLSEYDRKQKSFYSNKHPIKYSKQKSYNLPAKLFCSKIFNDIWRSFKTKILRFVSPRRRRWTQKLLFSLSIHQKSCDLSANFFVAIKFLLIFGSERFYYYLNIIQIEKSQDLAIKIFIALMILLKYTISKYLFNWIDILSKDILNRYHAVLFRLFTNNDDDFWFQVLVPFLLP